MKQTDWELVEVGIFLILIAVLALVMMVRVNSQEPPPIPEPKILRLSWDYPVEELTNITFYVYRWTNAIVDMSTVKAIKTVEATNEVTIPVLPGSYYFAVRASNIWGLGDFSNVASTPPLPRSDVKLNIERAD